MKKCFFIFLLIVLSCAGFAQNKFEIGLESGITNDRYTIDDPLNNLRTVPCLSGGGGVAFRYNSKNHFFYEAALLLRESAFGYKYKGETSYSTTGGDDFLHLPLRAGYYFGLSDKINLSAVIGIVPSYVAFRGLAGGESIYFGSSTQFQTIDQQRDLDKNFFFLLQGGVSLDFKILNRVRLSINPNYYIGTSRINIYDVDYTVSNSQGSTGGSATINGNGSFIQYNLGIRYQFAQRKN